MKKGLKIKESGKAQKRFKDYSVARKLFNIFGVLILILVFIEIFLRLLGLVFLLKFDRSVDVSAKSDLKILCEGDSWTIGNWRDNYPKFLKIKLKNILPDKKIEVINSGIAGSNSTMAVKKIRKELPLYKPDIVIVMTGNNDHWNLTDSTYWLFQNRKLSSWDLFFARIKITVRSLRTYKLFNMIYRKIFGIPTTNEFFYLDKTSEADRKEIVSIDRKTFRKQLEFNLVKIIELCRVSRTQLIFMTYFHFHGYHVNEYIRDIALRFGIPLIDNNFLFHKMIDPDKYRNYLIPDGHPNGKGYNFIADRIIEKLIEKKIVKTGKI